MAFDLEIIETGNGGDLRIAGNDLSVVNGIENMIYLGMFGGNLEATTESERPREAFDFWANRLLLNDDRVIQLNSITEKTLNSVSLNSSGRLELENAIKNDLKFLSPDTNYTVTVDIISDDRISVYIRFFSPIGKEQVIKIGLSQLPDGDFVIDDFNNDFLV